MSAIKYFAVVCLCLVTGLAWSAAATTIQQTGRLKNKDGSLLTGGHTLTFRLYPKQDTAVDDNVWKESAALNFSDGTFAVVLGQKTSLDPVLLLRDNAELFIGFQVDGDDEFKPRFRLGAVPFALVARSVDGGTVNPTSVSIGGKPVIDATGKWVGDPAGLKGDKGDKGETGATGAKGDAGATGPKGDTVIGQKGDKGDKGDTGATGAKGDTGATGAKGDKGDSGGAGNGAFGFEGPTDTPIVLGEQTYFTATLPSTAPNLKYFVQAIALVEGGPNQVDFTNCRMKFSVGANSGIHSLGPSRMMNIAAIRSLAGGDTISFSCDKSRSTGSPDATLLRVHILVNSIGN